MSPRDIVFYTNLSYYYYFFVVVALVFAVLAFYACSHALRTRPDAFEAIDTLSKSAWGALLGAMGVVLLLSTVSGSSLLQLAMLASVVTVSVYLVGTRRRLEDIQRGAW